MGLNSYRKQWLRLHAKYEKKAAKVFLKVFRKWGRSIDFDSINVLNYSQLIDNAINEDELKKAFEDVYLSIALAHGLKLGKNLNKTVKFFSVEDFPEIIQNFIRNWLAENNVEKIRLIQAGFKKELVNLIVDGIRDNLTNAELTSKIKKFVNRRDFYRWQAQRIARTETTTSANLSTLKMAETLPYRTNKVWISATDARTRKLPDDKYDHLSMNGNEVGLYDLFEVPNVNMTDQGQLLYPGDPKGKAGNIINCRCTIGIVPLRDKDGMLIMK